MNTITRKALSATTTTGVLLARFDGIDPNSIRELVDPMFLDSGTVAFLTNEGALECPVEFWADGSLARLAHTVGWLERTSRQPVALPRGMKVDFFGGRPFTGLSPEATVLSSLRADI